METPHLFHPSENFDPNQTASVGVTQPQVLRGRLLSAEQRAAIAHLILEKHAPLTEQAGNLPWQVMLTEGQDPYTGVNLVGTLNVIGDTPVLTAQLTRGQVKTIIEL